MSHSHIKLFTCLEFKDSNEVPQEQPTIQMEEGENTQGRRSSPGSIDQNSSVNSLVVSELNKRTDKSKDKMIFYFRIISISVECNAVR